MNKQNMLHERFRNTEPSSTLRINEISNKLLDEGKNVYKFGLGQSPFPVPEILIETLKKNGFSSIKKISEKKVEFTFKDGSSKTLEF